MNTPQHGNPEPAGEHSRRQVDMVSAAGLIAAAAHTGQVDKAGQPYIGHPRRVASLCADSVPDSDAVRTVALLHDVAEDTSVTLDMLAMVFPADVVAAVDAITHRKGEPRDDYYRRVAANTLAFQVKLFDIADNSDPARLSQLDDETRRRLLAKYLHALGVLEQARAEYRTANPAEPQEA